MSYEFAPGSTGKSIQFLLRDATTAQPKPGLGATSPGATAAYARAQQTATPIALVDLGTANAAWQAGGIFNISGGLYRLDLPDAALSAGEPFVSVLLSFTGAIGEGALILLRNPVNNVGAGAIAWTITVQRSDNSQPIANAEVWVSTDLAGTNVVAGTLVTNNFGQVTFYLDAGTYYVWIADEGYTGTNPTQITVA